MFADICGFVIVVFFPLILFCIYLQPQGIKRRSFSRFHTYKSENVMSRKILILEKRLASAFGIHQCVRRPQQVCHSAIHLILFLTFKIQIFQHFNFTTCASPQINQYHYISPQQICEKKFTRVQFHLCSHVSVKNRFARAPVFEVIADFWPCIIRGISFNAIYHLNSNQPF